MLRKLMGVIILTAIVFITLIYEPIVEDYFINKKISPTQEEVTTVDDSTLDGMERMLGLGIEEVMRQYGMPTRSYPTMYGYERWMYVNENDLSTYFHIGVAEGKIVSLFIIGENIITGFFQIGDSYEEIAEKHPFFSELSFSYGGSDYVFSLSEKELLETPLIQMDEDLWALLYFDTFENKLSSVRLMNTEILLLLRPFQLTFTDELPALPQLTDAERSEMNAGEEQTILELTNVMRARFGLAMLSWNEQAAEVALSHSKDMKNNQFFSHSSPTSGELGDRVQRAGVTGTMFAENISANSIDAIAAIEGWMNSKGHRESILNENFTSLGVGVYNRYYTQNFVKE